MSTMTAEGSRHAEEQRSLLSVGMRRGCCTAQECVDDFSAVEELTHEDSLRCPGTGRMLRTSRSCVVQASGAVLFVHLKRFEQCQYSGAIRKSHTPVQCSSVLQVDGVYRLTGIIHHHGIGPGHGHYTATLITAEGVMQFDDSNISRGEWTNEAPSNTACILAYVKVGGPE
eukprot:TRINITY_DN90050_c0_g1_i1.p1 TRINITY_DN90050_c0_g1~~TRINITY_DN90050_c0_g1_i1.p1  ORF type:complete len:171 (-),score=21.55 TRINITY_DN90050_c0_g1_i1:374-886(-)